MERLYNANQLASRSQSPVDSISLDSQIAKIRFQENEFDRAAQDTAVEAFHREIKQFDEIVDEVQSGSGLTQVQNSRALALNSQPWCNAPRSLESLSGHA